MKFAIYNSEGDILRVGECPDEHVSLQASEEGEIVYQGEATVYDRINPVTGVLIPNGKPPQPTTHHEWDNTGKVWVPNLATLRAEKSAAIETERDRRITSPTMTYDGKLLDADARAVSNVNNKLAALNSAVAISYYLEPSKLVWRDANNVTHTWETVSSYKAWLDGFAIALEGRGSDAYAWSWTKKAALAALTTYEQLLAFDPLA